MKTPLPEFYFDENLREVCKDPAALKTYVHELKESLQTATDPLRQVSILGELGVHLRTLNQLDEAEASLHQALQIALDNNLGLPWEVQQKIRLAHVLQWQKNFGESNRLFAEVLEICRNEKQVQHFLAFTLQHSGKNFFDQSRFREALISFIEALAIREKEQAPQDQIESTKIAIARSRVMLAGQF